MTLKEFERRLAVVADMLGTDLVRRSTWISLSPLIAVLLPWLAPAALPLACVLSGLCSLIAVIITGKVPPDDGPPPGGTL